MSRKRLQWSLISSENLLDTCKSESHSVSCGVCLAGSAGLTQFAGTRKNLTGGYLRTTKFYVIVILIEVQRVQFTILFMTIVQLEKISNLDTFHIFSQAQPDLLFSTKYIQESKGSPHQMITSPND